MTDSQNAASHAAARPPHATGGAMEAFGEKVISDDFAGAAACMKAPGAEADFAHFADILLIEIETRLEADDAAGAKKCLELLGRCAPERVEEGRMWFG
ncbi:MAG: hypothetical protein KGH63_03780, partial [Candidatus Micrarchaeota archaeon]|nr:hypothetical protein [Candidatus Micrarchaeota archaeon]